MLSLPACGVGDRGHGGRFSALKEGQESLCAHLFNAGLRENYRSVPLCARIPAAQWLPRFGVQRLTCGFERVDERLLGDLLDDRFNGPSQPKWHVAC
jgi:hypothetical protein